MRILQGRSTTQSDLFHEPLILGRVPIGLKSPVAAEIHEEIDGSISKATDLRLHVFSRHWHFLSIYQKQDVQETRNRTDTYVLFSLNFR